MRIVVVHQGKQLDVKDRQMLEGLDFDPDVAFQVSTLEGLQVAMGEQRQIILFTGSKESLNASQQLVSDRNWKGQMMSIRFTYFVKKH
jgi:hypothetical protein